MHARATLVRHDVRLPNLQLCADAIDWLLNSDDRRIRPRIFIHWYCQPVIRTNRFAERRACHILSPCSDDRLAIVDMCLQAYFVARIRYTNGRLNDIAHQTMRRILSLGIPHFDFDSALLLISNLKAISAWLPEHCMLVAWRTILNVWLTRARFGVRATCPFCCRLDMDDMDDKCNHIRHLLRCSAVAALCSSLLIDPNQTGEHVSLRSFFMAAIHSRTVLARHVVLLDALFRVHCTARSEGTTRSHESLVTLSHAR